MTELPSTAEEFLELHPWPDALRGEGRPLTFLAFADVDADADAMWPYISDIARLSRAAGLGRMQVEERDGRAYGRRRHGPVMHHFEELGWEWSHGVWFAVTRRFQRGLGRVGRDFYRVDPRPDGGSRVYVSLSWVPRGPLSALALRIGVPGSCRRVCRVLQELAPEARTASWARVRAKPMPGASERIGALAAKLADLPETTVSALVQHIETGDDIDLDRIRPLELASDWEIADDDAVRTCLHATRAGLLEMSWDVLCPHCRGVRTRAHTLGEIPRASQCEACAIEFGTDAAGAVEVSFQAHPSIRRRQRVLYCTAEPARKRHIVLQQHLEPGERREVESRLLPGRYRMRLVGSEHEQRLRLTSDAPERPVWVASATSEDRALVAATASSIGLVNDTDTPFTFVIEDESSLTRALRPEHLFCHPDFRDLFSEQYLAADVHLHVGQQAILFTDIVGSTAFYASRGDPDAFVEVVRHFEMIDAEVRRHGGAVVKTIGDAAMAAFSDACSALACSEALLTHFAPGSEHTPIRIRASLNTGPCIAVRLNSNIDYFGTTVNFAAKLQSCAGASELALSEAVRAAPGVEDYLRRRGVELTEVDAPSEAGSGRRAYRWDVCGNALPASAPAG